MAESKFYEYEYSYDYEWYYNQGLYIFKLKCENFWPCVGKSKYLEKARSSAYKNMLFNIENNITFDVEDYKEEDYNEDLFDPTIDHEEEKRRSDFSKKLDSGLIESKATEEEKRLEMEEFNDSLFDSDIILGWNIWDDKLKKQYLDNELDKYQKNFIDRPLTPVFDSYEGLKSLKVPVARPSAPIFGKPMKLYRAKTKS